MIATRPALSVAIALADEATDNAYIMIPDEARYNQVIPKFLADYGLDLDRGGKRITIPGPMAEEKAREYTALLNKRVDDFIAGTGSTMTLPPRPYIQLPSLVFYPIKLRWDDVLKTLAKIVGVLAVLYACYWLIMGIGYIAANSSTDVGDVVPNHNWGLMTGKQLTIHVSVDNQFTIKNIPKAGIQLPQNCRRDEKPDGLTVLMCRVDDEEVPVINLPELRSHQPDTEYYGRTLGYPATIASLPDDSGR